MEQFNIQDILSFTNLRKQYSLLNNVIHQYDTTQIIKLKKTLLLDLFNSCFDESLLIGGQVLQKLLTKLYNELGKEDKKNVELFNQRLQQFVSIFVDDYIESVKQNQNNYNLNYAQQINRILADVKIECIQYIIDHIIKNDQNFYQHKHKVWAIASLLKFAKLEQQISVTEQGIIYKNGTILNLDIQIIQKWMYNIDRAIQFEALQIFTLNSKKAAKPTQIELDSIILFVQHVIKTSYPNFKKNYLQKLKFFFERIRASFQKDLKLLESGKSKDTTPIQPIIKFTQQILDILYSQLIPECCYEVSSPCLEILKMIYMYLGTPEKLEPKKGEFYDKTLFLLNYCLEQAYGNTKVEQLIIQCSSNWESSRTLAYEILLLLPNEIQFFSEQKAKELYQIATSQIGNPIIKFYESGSLLLSLLLKKYANILYPTQNPEIEFLNYLVDELQQKFNTFKQVFSNDIVQLQQTLIHGYISTFWIILQRNNIHQLQDKEQLKLFFIKLLELLKDIIEFATQVSSENVCTWIIDDKSTQQLPYQVDCRGHFYQTEFVQNVQKILQGNTLIESLDDQTTDQGSENILVVSFFLITRESGVFFQELAKVIDQMNDNLIPNDLLKRITYQFFHALLNIKHLGSIDRIAQGLYELCKTMGVSKNPQLPGLVNELIDKLVEAFDQNQLKNVFRRSAGLPHLVCCLLRSCQGKDKQTEKVVKILLKFARDGQLEMRIHALNVIRKLFMEAWLRQDLDQFIQEAYMLAIDGFSYDDWSVRNSSLMLFSALASRTLGKNTQNVEQIAQKLTLIEFFNKSPQLVQYFQNKIKDYNDEQLYPSLYPIALLLSRLAPMEGKFIRKVYTEIQKQDLFEQKQLDQLLPSLINCLKNKNYLGRVILSKAILPFLSFQQITSYVVELLKELIDSKTIKRNHNNAHGILLLCHQLIKDYYNIKRETLDQYEDNQIEQLKQSENTLIQEIHNKRFIICEIKCPPVLSVYYQVLNIIIKNNKQEDCVLFQECYQITKNMIEEQHFNQQTFKIQQDMGHSLLRKKQISFLVKLDHLNKSHQYLEQLIKNQVQKYIQQKELLEIDDLEVLQQLYKQYNTILKKNNNVEDSNIEIAQLTYQLLEVIETPYFSQCLKQCLKFLLIISKLTKLNHNEIILDQINKKFINDSGIMKNLIKLYGYVMLQKQEFLDQFLKICELYSHSNNIDDLRIAVIKSICIAIPNLINLNTLKLSLIYLRLLQDELPEIRNKMSKQICIHLLNNKNKNSTELYNNEYLLHNYYQFIVSKQITKENQVEIINILITQLMDSEYYMIKRQNHQSKRIFQYEKSNKYISELKGRKLAYDFLVYCVNNKILDQELVIKELNEYEIRHQNTALMEYKLSEIQIINYINNLTERDDFIYENMCRLTIFEELQTKFNSNHNQYELYHKYNLKRVEFSFQQFD
ncbi:unnamed protein product [Paramecium pentaurelia]|uniref:DUF2428 domain-containing protein n=1 Tax=Paramecium pentaurelia TaxID=43138 RepID=A0A8S1XK55_9CILI|nr:unnamed protein product [Paramecium pentaurelia]